VGIIFNSAKDVEVQNSSSEIDRHFIAIPRVNQNAQMAQEFGKTRYFVARVFNPCPAPRHGLKTRATAAFRFLRSLSLLICTLPYDINAMIDCSSRPVNSSAAFRARAA